MKRTSKEEHFGHFRKTIYFLDLKFDLKLELM